MDLPDGLVVVDGQGVEGFVIATGTPPVVFLGNDVECRRLGTLGAETLPSCNMASKVVLEIASRSGTSRRGRQVTCGSGIVRMW
jgi:hypothetical protein